MKNNIFKDTGVSNYIQGIWGPFTDIIDQNHPVYEAGTSCSGKLLDHLFNTHNAASNNVSEDITMVESKLDKWELENNRSFHWCIKHIFYYGDLDGNRTPFADPDMRAMFIGENADTSYNDLMKKYLACLEFLAFQIKLQVSLLKSLGQIDHIIITGSQAKNKRLLNLISLLISNCEIWIPREDINLMGVKGAFIMGKCSSKGLSLAEYISKQKNYLVNDNEQFIRFKTSLLKYKTEDISLRNLLNVKYQIHLDMARTQQRYRNMVDDAINSTLEV